MPKSSKAFRIPEGKGREITNWRPLDYKTGIKEGSNRDQTGIKQG